MKNNKIKHMSQTHTRSFGGKIDGFADKQERAHEKRHLRAYLKGWKYFQHGRRQTLSGFEPVMFEVKEIWTPKTNG